MTWTVYVARCRDGSLYTGVTTDPARRLAEHNSGAGASYWFMLEPLMMSKTIFDKLRASGTNELLLLDKRGRPYKWLRRGDLMRAKGSLARAGTLVHDTVTRDATLRDALEAVLTDNAGRVAVTGRRGEYTGVVDMETLMNSVHEMLEADRLEAMEHQHELEEQRAELTHAAQEGTAGEAKA